MGSRLSKTIKDSLGEAKRDLTSISWKGWLTGLGLFIWISVLIAVALLLAVSLIASYPEGVACTPDGTFSLSPDSYINSNYRGFFQISVAFGRMEFRYAKMIDIIWDMVFGRGLQAIMSFVSWHVFALYITTSMETTPVTF
ncbi:hypothetical protein P280DRAFT_526727 [Massarina eburnea CBS 473.64]|uniref:Uncharacterized protein n=1 Tax=Massarina eburnea CBS 473.64 TaxID=1395130 RepID=A0A6A6S2B6_9PLEO|nr:hypothetical protein P280DRAFT_526727 [Massarina eburnea CBS 473.64]